MTATKLTIEEVQVAFIGAVKSDSGEIPKIGFKRKVTELVTSQPASAICYHLAAEEPFVRLRQHESNYGHTSKLEVSPFRVLLIFFFFFCESIKQIGE